MISKIANAINEKEEFITDVSVNDRCVDFRVDGVWYFARLSRGKVLEKNVRRHP